MDKGNRNNAIRISLIDVMYGVVLAYGFQFIDEANSALDYLLFSFTYAVIIIDWLYVHSLYRGWEYKYNSFFIADLLILFSFSRMLYTSTLSNSQFWLWMSLLFLFYFAWDTLSRWKHLSTEYDWRYSMAGDLSAFIAYFIVYILLLSNVLQVTIWLYIGTIIFYAVVVLTWFKKQAT